MFLVKVMIFKTVPNFEKIWKGGKTSNAIIITTTILFNNIIQFIKGYKYIFKFCLMDRVNTW